MSEKFYRCLVRIENVNSPESLDVVLGGWRHDTVLTVYKERDNISDSVLAFAAKGEIHVYAMATKGVEEAEDMQFEQWFTPDEDKIFRSKAK